MHNFMHKPMQKGMQCACAGQRCTMSFRPEHPRAGTQTRTRRLHASAGGRTANNK